MEASTSRTFGVKHRPEAYCPHPQNHSESQEGQEDNIDVEIASNSIPDIRPPKPYDDDDDDDEDCMMMMIITITNISVEVPLQLYHPKSRPKDSHLQPEAASPSSSG